MPLTLTLTEGVLPKGQEKLAFARLSEAMLKWHGLTGNQVMTSNIVGSIHVLAKDQTFTGMRETPVAIHRMESAILCVHRSRSPGRLLRRSNKHHPRDVRWQAAQGQHLHQRRPRRGWRLELRWQSPDQCTDR